jgi:hypothetical protein
LKGNYFFTYDKEKFDDYTIILNPEYDPNYIGNKDKKKTDPVKVSTERKYFKTYPGY